MNVLKQVNFKYSKKGRKFLKFTTLARNILIALPGLTRRPSPDQEAM